MKVEINHRDNGACPLCTHNGRCIIQDKIRGSLYEFEKDKTHEMELVIYTCPRFKEKI